MAATLPKALKLTIYHTGPAVTIPAFGVYGTAWKKEKTAELVKQAIEAGFRGVDTAAQPKHYREDLVGEGIRAALDTGTVRREDLYIQTKFTPWSSQDPTQMPYDLKDPLPTQIHTSLSKSFSHLRHTTNPDDTYLDCLVLHGPFPEFQDTLAAWRIFEAYVPHRIRSLGISNVGLSELTALYNSTHIKPSVVQNRFYYGNQYDTPLRRFCHSHNIILQTFWTLTANPNLVQGRAVERVVEGTGVSYAVALYALVMSLGGTVPLCGTKDRGRMERDLKGVEMVREWAVKEPGRWQVAKERFEEELEIVVNPVGYEI
ncbi:aldo-keto reductase [Ascobolus immersus RN42]|uniref:Aldo-keto reductase n=1 Tax=Ascobolus immersus RN42 TaxID=1160509 RepID=A0A3N4I9Z4_ASCIM|nr:aldo-keto reductase [Ascobolus immersus RN42]